MLVLEPPVVDVGSLLVDPSNGERARQRGRRAKLDLELELDERPEGHIDGQLIYDRDLFDRATAERMTAHWLRLIDIVVADPSVPISAVPIVTEAEERRQVVEWNATVTDHGPGAMHDLISGRAARQPHAPAVTVGGQRMDYGSLDRRARWLSHRLRVAGVASGDVVAVCSEPSIDLVAGALGVLHAGAAHLVLDPGQPAASLARRIADAGATVVLAPAEVAAVGTLADALAASAARLIPLSDGEGVGGSPDRTRVGEKGGPSCCVWYGPADLATNGGDEVGLGQVISHRAAVDLCLSLASSLSVGPADTVLVLRSALFSMPLTHLWMPLVAGARLVVAPTEGVFDGTSLSRLIADEKVSLLYASPATWQLLVDTGLRPARSLRVLSGGGRLPPPLAAQLLDRFRVVWNTYTAPGSAVPATLGLLQRGMPATIGRPIANTRVYVVDGYGLTVPIGVTGQLLVAGNGTGGGLGGVDHPNGGGKIVPTGDLARWRADGQLELMS